VTQLRSVWVEIDLRAVRDNVRALRSLLRPGCLFMAVVKADGYGHGAERVARAAMAAGADRLGVATVEEGVRLRQEGIEAPILVLSQPPVSAVRVALDHELTVTLYDARTASVLSEQARRSDRVATYHLKVDTGMNRIGVRAEEAADLMRELADLPALDLEGIFTHFATADVPGDWDFQQQVARFGRALREIKEVGVEPGIVHAANSAATILAPDAHHDMVRCGISIYGLHAADSTRDRITLTPAMSVKGCLAQVKHLAMGDGVSYGLAWRASGPTTVAALPLGYADGVHRCLSDKMSVLIGGKRCDQVGVVCMDQAVVQIGRGIEAQAGDEFVLVGVQGGERITMDELADLAGTINYEMVCGFGMRLHREYS